MNSLTVGFVKWAGGKVVDDELGLVVDGYRPPHRNELGDLDSKTWEKENDGALKDPWQKATMLVFVGWSRRTSLYLQHSHGRRAERDCGPVRSARADDRRRRTISGR